MSSMIGSTVLASLVDKPCIGLDAHKVRTLREACGYTLAEAAERAGLGGPQKWSDIESGRRKNLTLDTLDKIAKALGVSAKDLLK